MLVIVPAYNEEASLKALLRELFEIFPPERVLVVNDGSTDNTSAVARGEGANVIDLPLNMGIGVAMQTGYKFAKENGCSHAVQCDADGQHVPSNMRLLADEMSRAGSDLVIGSRFLGGGKTGFQSSYVRRRFINFFSWWINVLVGMRVYDVTSGFRLCNDKAIRLFAEEYPFDYPEPEAIILAIRAGLKVSETPTAMRERQGGVSSIGFFSGAYFVVKVSLGLLIRRLRRTN
ncbi:MAG: glycosyltransferase family 2 protein [Nitrospinae bacterium]|nr:glycosyltransferase family 2 protein [Nitrospinota bacterium]